MVLQRALQRACRNALSTSTNGKNRFDMKTAGASASSAGQEEDLVETVATRQTVTARESTPPVLDFEDRLAVCGECPHSRDVVQGFATFCTSCGCNIQAKAFFEHLHCPIGKW
mmetsp:Transcript_10348/g.18246  ORF Transcript_10348/g.18246 Transcript_10348/m.18246 type:complete len:113 (+) Transcript_10348:153-491(+)